MATLAPMSSPTGCRLLMPAALLLVAMTALAPPAAAKGKKVTCNGSKIAVTIGKKTTCQPFAKQFPKPKAIDLRLSYLQQALKFDTAKTADGKKRKRARTLQSGFGAAGKRAQRKLLKVLPKVLAFIDEKGGGARSSRLIAEPALASRVCEVGPAGPTAQTGGVTMGTLGDNGGFVEAPAGGGLRVRVTFVSCGGVSNFRIPECPTANGSVDATGSGEFRATTEIWKGDELVSRNSSTFGQKAKVHGEVGADALLKFIEVEHTQKVFFVASGGIVIRGGVTRKVKTDMPGGRYDPAGASVRIFGDSIASDSGARAFASTAEAAISGYRGAEARWSTFNPTGGYCAEPVLSPDSNTLKLKKGDTGQLSIYAKARQDGGGASEATWTLLDQENAEFSPTSSDAAPTISYTVTNAPENGFVKVKIKFSSTAGVGEKTWTQPTEPPMRINHLTGTFGGEVRLGDQSIQSWNGNVTLDHLTGATAEAPANGVYVVSSGNVMIQALGRDQTGTGCEQSGSLSGLKLRGGFAEVTAIGPEGKPPYTYSITLSMPSAQLKITRSNCPEGAEEFEGTEAEIGALYGLNVSGQESVDGQTYFGTFSYFGTQNWNLSGVK